MYIIRGKLFYKFYNITHVRKHLPTSWTVGNLQVRPYLRVGTVEQLDVDAAVTMETGAFTDTTAQAAAAAATTTLACVIGGLFWPLHEFCIFSAGGR